MRNPLAVVPQRLRRRLAHPLSSYNSLSPFSTFSSMSPLRSLSDLENEMDRWMQGSFGLPDEIEGYSFAPTCTCKETNKEFIFEFDIPGVKKDDVKIEIENNRLVVSGERSDKREEKDTRNFLAETSYGSFMRSFNLPASVDENRVDAHYEDGVLVVKIPKTQTSKAREIRIH